MRRPGDDAVDLEPLSPETVRAACDLGSPGPVHEALGFVVTGEPGGDEPVHVRPL